MPDDSWPCTLECSLLPGPSYIPSSFVSLAFDHKVQMMLCFFQCRDTSRDFYIFAFHLARTACPCLPFPALDLFDLIFSERSYETNPPEGASLHSFVINITTNCSSWHSLLCHYFIHLLILFSLDHSFHWESCSLSYSESLAHKW